MPMKTDTMQNIKVFMATQEKNTGKPKPVEHKNSGSKQYNTNINKVKEASPTESKQKHKAIKNTKEHKSISDSMQTPTPTSAKHDASVRSPLEGNPEKKQCDNIGLKDTTENTKQTTIIEQPHAEDQTKLLTMDTDCSV